MTDIEKFLTPTIEELKKERDARDRQVVEDIINVILGEK